MKSKTQDIETGPLKELKRFISGYLKTKFYNSGLGPREMRDRTHQKEKHYRTLADDCAPVLAIMGEVEIWSQAQRQRPSDSDAQVLMKLTDVPDGPASNNIPLQSYDDGDDKHLELGNMTKPQMERAAAYCDKQADGLKKTAEEIRGWIAWREAHGLKPDATIFEWLAKQAKRKAA